MSWLERLNPRKILRADSVDTNRSIPEGVWTKCDACESTLYREELEKRAFVCFKCNHHMRISARQRLNYFFDSQGSTEIDAKITTVDSLKFRDTKKYPDRLATATKTSKENEALISMQGRLHGMQLVATCFEFNFMGGSMGSVVGEKFVRAVNRAIETSSPLICFSASGGARMQESMKSLLQMSKTSAALRKLRGCQLPFISVLTDPTMGGVSASLAMLGDVIVAEPNALIGFAGPRVIEQTVREKLPEGFQRSEFLLEHGAIDRIISRTQMRQEIHKILCLLTNQPLTTNLEV